MFASQYYYRYNAYRTFPQFLYSIICIDPLVHTDSHTPRDTWE